MQAAALAGYIGTDPLVSKQERNAQKPMRTPFQPAYLELEQSGELAYRAKQFWAGYKKCRLCPRNCEINRLAGENKTCRAADKLKVYSAFAHFGEERPLVGRYGSGTIFFSYCNLRCCFCQNWQINHRGDGTIMSHKNLARTMLALQNQGCHNINLVTPTHMVPHILRALRYAIQDGLHVPLVYNTGGYDSLETIQMLQGVIDIYMPDFKFQDGSVAHKYAEQAKNYPEKAASAIQEMHRQVGVLQKDNQGVALRGLILRHLVMPDNLAGTDRFVRWVSKTLSPDTYVNLMDQYRPEHLASSFKEISRKISLQEWSQAQTWAREAGLVNLD